MTYLVVDRLQSRSRRGWEWDEFRRIARPRRSSNTGSRATLLALSTEHGIVPRAADGGRQLPSAETVEGYWVVEPNDFVFNPMWAVGGGVAVSSIAGAVSTAYRVYTLSDRVHPRFIHYYMRSGPLVEQYSLVVRGLTTFDRSVTRDDLESLPVPVPPLSEQRAIADFLDAETARIEALITKKRRLIDLLRDQPRSRAEVVIQDLLTSVPQTPLKYLVTEQDARLGDEDAPELLSVSIHQGAVPRATMTDKLPRAEELSNYKLCKPGDIAINRMRAFQGGVGVVRIRGIVSPDYTVLRPGPQVDSAFLHHLFRSPWFVGEMTCRLRGIGGSDQGNVRTPRVNFADLGLVQVPTPTRAAQARIASELSSSAEQTADLVRVIERQLDLLVEHRQALITAAVTGELEIPGVAA